MNLHAKAEQCFREAKRHTRRKLSMSSLEKKLDRVFSEYVRKMNADERGMVSCVTCGKLMHWKECHASHFVKRQHRATRWDERNVHPQCPRENVYMGGRQDLMALYILNEYGADALDEVITRGHSVVKHSRADLEQMISLYQSKLAELEQ